MNEINVAGIIGDQIDVETRKLVENSDVLVCSKDIRLVLLDQGCRIEDLKWVPIAPVQTSLEKIREYLPDTPVTVLTSGDPLFYGIGKLLNRTFPENRIRFQPALSSMQLCFARFGIPWDDASFISLHGRPLERLHALDNFTKVFLFTDPVNSPQAVARHLLEVCGAEGCVDIVCHIGERLGTAAELLYSGSVPEVAVSNFAEPNCMILLREPAATRPAEPDYRFGLTEERLHHSRGLITKNEVRAAVLHSLELPECGVMWDVGSGSGSISIESSRMCPQLEIYSVERNDSEIDNIRRNKADYHCTGVTVVHGEAPAALEALPLPNRIFIGGSGGNLEEIIRFCDSRFGDRGHIVLTAITENTYTNGPRLLHELGYRVRISVLSTKRITYPETEQVTLNPIHLIVAKKDIS